MAGAKINNSELGNPDLERQTWYFLSFVDANIHICRPHLEDP